MKYRANYFLRIRNVQPKQLQELKKSLSFYNLIFLPEEDKSPNADIIFDNFQYVEKDKELILNVFTAKLWYNHVETMIMLAETFSSMTFELECIEENLRFARKEYYHDMDVEACYGEVVYEQPKKVQWQTLIDF